MNNEISYKAATTIYRNLAHTTPLRNRRVKIAAIKRALENLDGYVTGVKCESDRTKMSALPRLVVTYTHITHLTSSDMLILHDLQQYLDGSLEGGL